AMAHLLWHLWRQPLLCRVNRLAILVREVVKVFDLPLGDDSRVSPGAVHILAAELLWGAHTDERFSAFTHIHFRDRTSKTVWSPPLPDHVGVGPSLPYRLDWRVEDTGEDEILLLIGLMAAHILFLRWHLIQGAKSSASNTWRISIS